MNRFLVCVIALLLFVPASAAEPAVTEAWRASDTGYIGVMMDRDSQENLYSLGYSAVGDVIVVKKHSANGVLLWSRVFDPDYRIQGRWLAADAHGNVLVSAFRISSSDMPAGWVTLKYDANGTLLWKDEVDAFGWPAQVVVDADGNAYVAGTMWLTGCSGNTTWDFVTVKYGPDGRRLWVRHFDNGCGTSTEVSSSIALSPDGARLVVTGSFGPAGFLALSYDAAGNLLWSATRSDFFGGSHVAFTSATDAVITSSANSVATGSRMALLKFDGSGRVAWSRTYAEGEFADRLAVDSAGNLAVIGRSYLQGYSDWITLKTDAAGKLLWSQRLDASRNNDEVPTWVEFDRHGNVYVAGRAGPSPSTGMLSYLKGVVAKYAADGTRLWAVTDDALGLIVRLGRLDEVYFFGQGIMRIVRYDQTGATDPLPQAPGELSARTFFTGVQYVPVLSWRDAAHNEFWVEVERCTGAGCGNFAKVGQTRGENAVEFEDFTAAPGSTYTYRVRAVGFMGASAYSAPVTVTDTKISAPAAPSELTAAASGAAIVLAWKDNATDESQYYVERCEGAGCTSFQSYGVAPADAKGFTDSGAAAGVTYSYRVRAWNAGGYSGYSNAASAAVAPAASQVPTAPTGLQAWAVSKNKIALYWTNTATNQSGVRIERCTGAGCSNFARIAQVGGSATEYTNNGLKAGTSYTYRVQAFNASGASTYSAPATATIAR